MHDLGPAELVLGRVDLAAQQFVERRVAREDQGADVHLDRALAEAHEVGADAHGPARHVAQREAVLVGAARLAGDGARAAQVLDADAVRRADDGRQDEVVALEGPEHRARLQGLVVRAVEVDVLEALARVGLVVPLDLELGLELLDEADARAAVAGDVDAGDAPGPRVHRRRLVDVVLGHAEGPALERDVVRDDDELAARRVLRGLERHVPGDHADLVRARRRARRRFERRLGVVGPDELVGFERTREAALGALRRARQQPDEVVAERGPGAARRRAALREGRRHEVVGDLGVDGLERGPRRRRGRRHGKVRVADADGEGIDVERRELRRQVLHD
mmetsp:Transcript_18751/g.61084  ORF Transcript_18751/g.61084 Transcript_18751/m.61084 type:complete len:335 (+) Transcript_18751:2177-3181(+)